MNLEEIRTAIERASRDIVRAVWLRRDKLESIERSLDGELRPTEPWRVPAVFGVPLYGLPIGCEAVMMAEYGCRWEIWFESGKMVSIPKRRLNDQ